MSLVNEVQNAVLDCITGLIASTRPEEVATGPLLVAVSGGVDSMALLHAVCTVARQRRWDVQAVHVNHNLRPTSAQDAEWVTQVCASWQIPIRVYSVHLGDIPHHKRKGTEADARALRYEAMTTEARRVGASCVLLAHHADDQVETVLWRLMRGTSLTGLSGMRPLVKREGIYWLRPFLSISKAELAAYAKNHGVPHVEDETNASDAYTRNFLRHHVIPNLKQWQPRLPQAVSHLCTVLQDEDDFLEAEAKRAFTQLVKKEERGYSIECKRICALHRSLQRRLIKILLYCFASGEDWTFNDVEGILTLIHGQNPSAELHLSGTLRARREYGLLVVETVPAEERTSFFYRWQPEHTRHLELSLPNQRWVFESTCLSNVDTVRTENRYELYLPKVENVIVRTAMPGDRVRPLGLNGSKKVHDIFVDAKVPRLQRASWPLFEVDGNVVWIPGLVRSEHCLVVNPEQGVLRIQATPPTDSSRSF
ncbi:tRNA lysidine(34) synthetase TilS [Alicyclobacillus pomorum]|uniref:tRNA lysidine(34) synthetase TilS n=1 Tax=Alicyclobacillus pomorum TaxID=204470 RepID=UPI00047D6F50|nr:tRNA lysidine(34) synthetase TilS [Alicyclobacillus pomorum]